MSKTFFLFEVFSAPGLISQGLPSLDANIQDASADNNAIKFQIQSHSIFLPRY